MDRHRILCDSVSEDFIPGLVSCIIPSYKRCDTVERAINSVLNQTYNNIEVLVVNDNVIGDDFDKALRALMSDFKDIPNVHLVNQPKHINGAVARNVGIKEAKGEFIAFLDDDDEWLPSKIESQLSLLNDKVGACSCLWQQYAGGVVGKKCPVYTVDNIQFKILCRKVAVFTSTVLARKKDILKFGGFDETLIRHQDLQFLTELSEVTKFAVLNKHLVKLHIDSDINRPDVKKLIRVKQDFYSSVGEYIERYNKREQRRIRNAHYYEIAFSAIKGREYTLALRYLLKGGLYISSIIDLYNRMKSR